MNLLSPIRTAGKPTPSPRLNGTADKNFEDAGAIAVTTEPASAGISSGFCTLSPEVCDSLAVFSAEGTSKLAEQFRTLRVKLLTLPKPPQIVVVSSPMVGDGKTFTSLNLAASLAFPSRERVLLIDGDMRRSAVHSRLGLRQSPGLREVLEGEATLAQAVLEPAQLGGLSILPAGESPADPTALLGSAAWRELLLKLRVSYRRIIIDAPPTEGIGDFSMILEDADGVLLVCRLDHTQRDEMSRAIRSAKDKLLGVVMNGLTEEPLCKSPTSQYYRKGYRPEPKR